MVKTMITLEEDGQFAVHHHPGKTPIPHEGNQVVRDISIRNALRWERLQKDYLEMQEALYTLFYNGE